MNADHQPGQGYELTREQFFRFLEELEDQPLLPADWQEPWFDQRAALWRQISAGEANRVFTDMGCCPSVLSITTKVMEWEYVTTSGTCLLALDHRQDRGSVLVDEGQLQDPPGREDPDYNLPWDPDLKTLEIPQEGLYRVWIPEARDQPGRTAWTQIRLALSGLAYRSWSQELDPSDTVGVARTALREALRPADA